MKMNEKKLIGIGSIIALVLTIIIFLIFKPSNKVVVKEEEKIYYTVKFNSDGGNKIEDIKILKGEKLEMPKNPKKAGYVFANWYDKDNNVLSKDYKVTRNVTFKAKWIKEEVEIYTVTFDTVGGSNIAPIKVAADEHLVLPKNPTKEGYTFVIWEDENGTPVRNDVILFKDTTLKAIWKETYLCPAGFEKDGRKCIKTVAAEDEVACTSGNYDKDNDICLIEEVDMTKSLSCPSTSTLENEKCVQKEASNVELVDDKCPTDDYLLKDKKCYLLSKPEEEMVCPKGSVKIGDKCYKSSKPKVNKICSKDYQLVDNDKCQKTIDAEKNV